MRESIQFKCSHCGKTSHKDVSKDKYIDQHLKFGKLLWTYDTKKTCATGSPKEKFNDSLWEDEPYQIEGASRETLIGIIRNYTKFGHIIYAHEEEDNLSIKRLKEIIKVCEEENR